MDILWSDPADTDSDLGIFPNHLRDPQGAGFTIYEGENLKPTRTKNVPNMNK